MPGAGAVHHINSDRLHCGKNSETFRSLGSMGYLRSWHPAARGEDVGKKEVNEEEQKTCAIYLRIYVNIILALSCFVTLLLS